MTVKQDMRKLGIDYDTFDKFYQAMREDKSLPSGLRGGDEIPLKHYHTILEYLKEQGVVYRNNRVNGEALEVFDQKLSLEKILRELPSFEPLRNSGGVMPCRRSRSSDGITACRD